MKPAPNKSLTIHEVRILLGAFGFIIAVCGLLMLLFFRSVDPLYDFAAYVFPCAAGVVAGGGAFISQSGGSPDWLYKASVFLLFCGFMAYIRTKPCWEPLAVVIYFLLATVLSWILGRHLDHNSAAKNSWWATISAVGFFMIPVGFALVAMIYTVDNFGALFPTGEFRCYSVPR